MEELADAGFKIINEEFTKYKYITFLKEEVFFENNKHEIDKIAVFKERPTDPKRQKLEYIIKEIKDPVKFTSNNIYTCTVALSMLKNAIFFKNFRYVTQRLFEAGIIQRIPGKSDYSLSGKANEQSEIAEEFQIYNRKRVNVVLNWNDLSAGFYVWIGTVVLSIVVFVGENVKFRLAKLRNKLER